MGAKDARDGMIVWCGVTHLRAPLPAPSASGARCPPASSTASFALNNQNGERRVRHVPLSALATTDPSREGGGSVAGVYSC